MNDEELQEWIQEISLASFKRPFLHQATFNHRLRATGGRYFTRTHNIEISWRQYEKHGREEVEKIIKHELCHYHLHLMKRGYQHRDADFKSLLQTVGGSRFCQPVSDPKERQQPYRYKYVCKDCQGVYMRKRRIDMKKYACGRCRGKLQQKELDPKTTDGSLS